MHRSPGSRAWSAADPPSELASGSVVIINPDRSDSGRSRNDVDSGARDASIIRPSDDNGRSAGNTPGSSRAYPVDIPGPRKLEIRLLLILWAPERRVRRPPAQAICIFSSYWLFGLDARNGPITLLLCLDQAGSLAAQIWHLHRDLG